MLHELLVALRGHPGHIFCEWKGGFSVNPTLDLFHPCEVVILNQVSTTRPASNPFRGRSSSWLQTTDV